MRKRGVWPTLLSMLWTAALAIACGKDQDPRPTTLLVFAASSLAEAFAALEASFEAEHPDVDVLVSLAGSQVLRLQIEQGAAADVFASANEEHLADLAGKGLVTDGQRFAQNELTLIVSASDPVIQTFDELPRAKTIVVGSESVPVGAYTRKLMAKIEEQRGKPFATRIREHIVSEESNVRLVRAKVELGEADAAFVYRTDAIVSKAVRMIPIPEDLAVRAGYSIGRVVRSENPTVAEHFVDHVRSPQGQAILAEHGFSPP